MTHTNTREDQYGSSIGNGTSHVQYHAINTAAFPQVNVTVNTSGTTESVYVTYTNNDNAMSTTVRFSNHMSNAVMFGDQLDGALATDLQILFRIGLASRTFAPSTSVVIETKQIKKAIMSQYEECALTMQELYALGEGADISAHTGKLAKGSNRIIVSTTVVRINNTMINRLGEEVQLGTYTYAAN